MFGGDDDESLSQIGMMESQLLSPPPPVAAPQHHQLQQQSPQPQWSQGETRELIRIRAELERDFTVAKRNKTLWETVSSRMRERGYRRTPDQCKCKWKNLLNRYKQYDLNPGIETSGQENARQCPFFEELHAVFTERANNMQQLHLETEKASVHAKKKLKKIDGNQSSDEPGEDDEEEDEDTDEERPLRRASRKRKADKEIVGKSSKTPTGSESAKTTANVYELLKDFFEQQQRMDMEWREMMERRAHERLLFEQEWRESMEKLERERLLVEQGWREREEQRKRREESRAERRDALLTTLLNKLIHEHDQ